MQSSIRRTILKLIDPLSSSPHAAQFHSTPISLAKSRNSKALIRFAVRQKRADTKSALKDFLLYGQSSKLLNQNDGSNWTDEPNRRNANSKNSSHDFDDISRSKSSGKSKTNCSTSPGRGKHKSWQRKQRVYDIDDDMDTENVFKATFGGQKCYTWSFTWTEHLDFDDTSKSNFGGESREEKARKKFWNESDEDEEPVDVGCRSHRITLGLPPTGPLKMDDIKSAFRASALKWHPDKHQGPSQNVAAEKFKLCVTAYNSLRSALKPS